MASFIGGRRTFRSILACRAPARNRRKRSAGEWKEREEPEELEGSVGEFSALSNEVIAAAMVVHSSLGPGLLESPYRDRAQLATYMRFADRRTGLLINFNVLYLRDGILSMHR